MVHNPNARGRAPRYKVNDSLKPKGVTTILGKTLAKDLVSWAVGLCVDYLREKLPVVTEEDLTSASRAYITKRDSGANTGSEAHEMVERYLKGRPSTENGSEEAQNAYRAFVEWFEDAAPTVVNVEEVVYSERLEYAGTYDCMLEIDGKVYLCDLKTTNTSRNAPRGIYAEYFVQLGAYAQAHDEQRRYEEENGGTELRKVDDLMVISAKKDGRLDIVTASELGLTVQACENKFEEVINLHNFLTETTSKLGGR